MPLNILLALISEFKSNAGALLLVLALGVNAVYNEFTFASTAALLTLETQVTVGFKENELRLLEQQIWQLEGAKESGTITKREHARLGELKSEQRRLEREVALFYSELRN